MSFSGGGAGEGLGGAGAGRRGALQGVQVVGAVAQQEALVAGQPALLRAEAPLLLRLRPDPLVARIPGLRAQRGRVGFGRGGFVFAF